MLCPNCGKENEGGNFCPACGQNLRAVLPQEEIVLPELKHTGEMAEGYGPFPFGLYKMFTGSVELRENSFVFCGVLQSRKKCKAVAYEEITRARLIRTDDGRGCLFVRWKDNDHIAIADSADNIGKCFLYVTSIIVEYGFQIFCYLKQRAPKTAAFDIIYPRFDKADEQKIAEEWDAEAYFQTYSPCRRAAYNRMVLVGEKISLKLARQKVDRYFDKREMELYDKEPELLARDLQILRRKEHPWKEREKIRQMAQQEEFDKRKRALYDSGATYCPRCLCTDYTVGKRGYSRMLGVAGNTLVPGVGLVYGYEGENDVRLICKQCKYKWNPKTENKQ